MTTEYETQILDIDPTEISEKLKKLGAKAEPEILQRRWVYDIKAKNSYRWIRLRESGKKITICLKDKTTDNSINNTREIEIEVDNFDDAHKILSALTEGAEKYYQENQRLKFTLDDIEFTIDTWPMIRPYLEIEAKSEDLVHKGLDLLGLTGKDAGNIGTYRIFEHYGLDLHSFQELKFGEK